MHCSTTATITATEITQMVRISLQIHMFRSMIDLVSYRMHTMNNYLAFWGIFMRQGRWTQR